MMNMKKQLLQVTNQSSFENKEELNKEIENIFETSNNDTVLIIKKIEESIVFGQTLYKEHNNSSFYTRFKDIYLSTANVAAFK